MQAERRWRRAARVLTSTALGLCALLLGACQDSTTLAAATQLAADGKAASDALATYLNDAADTLESNCALDDFDITLVLRSKKQDVDTLQSFLGKCRADPSRLEMMRKLRGWANDARSVSAVYASLSVLVGAGTAGDSQKSVDEFVGELQTAAHGTVSPEVQPALDLLTQKAVEHREARAVDQFAHEMAAVPKALRSIIEGGTNPAALDEIYTRRDQLLEDATKDAYRYQMADPTPELSTFYGKLSLQLTDDVSKDQYLTVFAATLRTKPAGPSAKQLRSSVANLLLKVEDETNGLLNPAARKPSLGDEVRDVRRGVDELYAILHPAPPAGASSGGTSP